MTLLLFTLLTATPELESGRLAYARLEWAKAVELLSLAAADPKNTLQERLDACDQQARAALAQGNAAGAQAAYAVLLELDPMANDPEGSPKVRAAFSAAKARAFAPGFVKLVRRESAEDVLEVDVVNPWRVALRFRLDEQQPDGAVVPRPLEPSRARLVTALKPGSRNTLLALDPKGAEAAALGPVLGPHVELTPPPAAVVAPLPVPIVEPEASRARLSGRRLGALVSLGLSAVTVLTGVGLYYWGLDDFDKGDGKPVIPQTERDAFNASGRTKTIAGVAFFSVGLASAVVSALLFLLLD